MTALGARAGRDLVTTRTGKDVVVPATTKTTAVTKALPKEKETYIHRIGRSGRYGRKGVAINLLGDNEVEYLKHIESYYDTKINEMPADISEYLR